MAMYSISELDSLVHRIANYIVEKVCNETTTGEFRFSLDDIDSREVGCYFTDEDLYAYENFIDCELSARKEFEFLDYSDRVYSGECKREYCPNLSDRLPDEPLYPVCKPLSMTELSSIGKTAISALEGASISSLRDTLGMTFEQVHQIGRVDQDYYFSLNPTTADATGAHLHNFWSTDLTEALTRLSHAQAQGEECKLFFSRLIGSAPITGQLAAIQNGRFIVAPPHPGLSLGPNYDDARQQVESFVSRQPSTSRDSHANAAAREISDKELDIGRWKVVIIAPGDTYGRNGQLTHDEPYSMVEFRDMNLTTDANPKGILAARYQMEDIIGKDGIGGISPNQRIIMDDTIAAWIISASEMSVILPWLKQKESELRKENVSDLTGKIQDAEKRCGEQIRGTDANIKNLEH